MAKKITIVLLAYLVLAGCPETPLPGETQSPSTTKPPLTTEPPTTEPPTGSQPPEVPTEPVFAINLNCTEKVSGSWNFGVAPYACNVSPSMPQTITKTQYSPVLFDHSISSSEARNSYMTTMYALLRDVGTYYIKRRKPTVTSTEVEAFLEGLYALAHQETFWTHYRKPLDGIIRYMRGDYDHGHGMMQVDDRSHVAALKEGKGVDLGYNIVYGLDVYYAEWVRAATASCVGSATNYTARARSAWSAYNGGPSRLCRFATSPTSGDTSYNTKLQQKLWLKYVTNTSATNAFNIKCLVEGGRPCLLVASDPNSAVP